MPDRIQLRRTKGWRKPPDAIVVARPTKWGNPWKVGEFLGCDLDSPYSGAATPITPALAVELYRSAISVLPSRYPGVVVGLAVTVDDARSELAGHDLACWCPLDQPCHADILLDLANR
jgi:hypothetical protein